MLQVQVCKQLFIVIIPPTDGSLVIIGLFRTLRHFIDDMLLYLVEERLARIYRDEGPKHQHQPQPSLQAQAQAQATASGSSSSTGAPAHTNEDTSTTTAVTQPAPSTVEVEISSNDSP